MKNLEQFHAVTLSFTRAVEANDGEALAALFMPDGVYVDGFYGAFVGREAIAMMLKDHFWGHAKDFRWRMSNHALTNDQGYVTYPFSYNSVLPEANGKQVVFDGIGHFTFSHDLIGRYEEQFNTGMALAQLDSDAVRIKKHLSKKAAVLREAEAAG